MTSPITHNPAAGPPPAAHAAAGSSADTPMTTWQGDDFSFGDLLDLINPLQHIPIVSTIYHEITGDKIGVAPKVTGDALFGGVIGLVASVFDTALQAITGKDTADTMVAALNSVTVGDGNGNQGTAVASAFSNNDDEDDTTSDVAQADTTGPQVAAAAALPRTTGTTIVADNRTAAPSTPGRESAKDASSSEPDAPDIYQRGKARPLLARTAIAPATNPVKATAAPKPAAPSVPVADPALYQRLLASRPHPLESSVPLTGVRGVGAPSTLPPPRVLAANPRLVTAARSAARAPRTSGMSTGARVKLMQAARGRTPNGPDGLATATIARAMARYGAGAAGVPLSGRPALTGSLFPSPFFRPRKAVAWDFP